MPPSADADPLELQLAEARRLAAAGQFPLAEAAYAESLLAAPHCTEAASALAALAMQRGDAVRAVSLLEQACSHAPDAPRLALNLSHAYAAAQRPADALSLLEALVGSAPDFFPAWLHLGLLRDELGDRLGAEKAWYQAIKRAQAKRQWLNAQSTPQWLLPTVMRAMERVRDGSREHYRSALAALRERHGSSELRRIETALAGYLGECDLTPPDARQRPKFMYIPGLPDTPYLDPQLQPWLPQLLAAYPAIRAEALAVLAGDEPLQGFLDFRPGDRVGDYLAGAGKRPAWDAYFFYRHGKRFDAHHQRCPRTSAVLESIDLCRIRGQAPEICFSVLAPGSHILPHHGVTNARAVLHLPLLVPPDCALNIVDGEAHEWREGVPMMFDDSFGHEAWNRSDRIRVILLMDCWNPHLTEVERLAFTALVEAISDFEGESHVN
jgi:aspartate beta-hydroxylase